MPKRRADTALKGAPKLPCDRDQVAVRIHQKEYIIKNSFVTSFPCNYCSSSGEACVMDRTHHYSKCASCTRQGRVCRKDFHTGQEWDLLRHAEDKLSSNIEKNERELDLLEPELSDLQSHLAELHQQLLKKQKSYQEAMSRQHHLQKQMAFLKQRGFKMSEHDAELLQILDERKSSEQPDPVVEVEQLAATSENPNFTQMIAEIDQMSPSFWENFELPAGGIVGQVGGSPSDSQ